VNDVTLLGGKSEGGAAKPAAKADPMEEVESDIPFN
jgi:hypothetical protein